MKEATGNTFFFFTSLDKMQSIFFFFSFHNQPIVLMGLGSPKVQMDERHH